jgi:hypothetical protein
VIPIQTSKSRPPQMTEISDCAPRLQRPLTPPNTDRSGYSSPSQLTSLSAPSSVAHSPSWSSDVYYSGHQSFASFSCAADGPSPSLYRPVLGSDTHDKNESSSCKSVVSIREEGHNLIKISSEVDIALVLSSGKRELLAPPCLHCRLKSLPCDNTLPACNRCLRHKQNATLNGLSEKQFRNLDEPGILCLPQRPLLHHQLPLGSSGSSKLQLPTYTLLRLTTDDDETWARKLELESEVRGSRFHSFPKTILLMSFPKLLSKLSRISDQINWVLPPSDGSKAGFNARRTLIDRTNRRVEVIRGQRTNLTSVVGKSIR